MKISIVTISYNQVQFLEQAIRSVVEQDYNNVEYIVVDPGSTDGSREIIERFRDRIDKIIFESDNGPADGLNIGFAHAAGEIYGYTNADDMLMPGALSSVAAFMELNEDIGVVCGHVLIIDEKSRRIRTLYSDRFSLRRYVYGASIIPQQACFFRANIFHEVGGFNPRNRVAWDGELYIDMGMNGAMFAIIDKVLAAFRLQPNSITMTEHTGKTYDEFLKSVFIKVMHREPCLRDKVFRFVFRLLKYTENPKALVEGLRHGRMRKLIEGRNMRSKGLR